MTVLGIKHRRELRKLTGVGDSREMSKMFDSVVWMANGYRREEIAPGTRLQRELVCETEPDDDGTILQIWDAPKRATMLPHDFDPNPPTRGPKPDYPARWLYKRAKLAWTTFVRPARLRDKDFISFLAVVFEVAGGPRAKTRGTGYRYARNDDSLSEPGRQRLAKAAERAPRPPPETFAGPMKWVR